VDYYEWVKFALEHYQESTSDPESPLYGMVIIPVLGNEPNEGRFMEVSAGEFDPSTDRYLPFLQAGSKAANEVDEGLNVLVAPLSSDAGSEWFETYAANGAAYDNVAFNWYVTGELTDDNMGPLEDALAIAGDKDLYILEFGAYGSRHVHAQSIETAYLMASDIPNIKGLCAHSLVDSGDEEFGLLRFNPDNGKICAWEAYWTVFDLFNRDGERPELVDCT
jgi:hypothetical protein